MNMEQKMLHDPKFGLDGKFFYFTHDGKVDCREVGPGHSPLANFSNNYSKVYAAKGGKKSVRVRRESITWSDGQVAWLRANMKRKTISQCAASLNLPYHRVYDKIDRLRREEGREMR